MAVGVKTNPVNWFEIPVTNLERAKEFYERVFSTSLDVMNLGGLKMAWFPPAPKRAGNLRRLDRGTLGAVEKHGGKVVMPKTGGGEHGAVAQFEDSEGNLVALFSNA